MTQGKEISRRGMMRGLAFGAALAGCPVCAGIAQADEKGGHGGVHWGYGEGNGPAMWGKLSPDFKTCAIGTEQTPIDLRNAIKAELQGKLDINYQPFDLTVVNNGHTIQIDCPNKDSTVRIMGRTYYLAQFHFHHPSEHLLDGQSFPMEIHFVHRANPDMTGDIAVVGVFVREGNANPYLEQVFHDLPPDDKAPRAKAGVLNPAALISNVGRGYFRYYGSLTTPPCTEGLVWTVLRQPIEASKEQIGRFAGIFPMNARPVLPLARRFLLESN